MHPRNRHAGRYDFDRLTKSCPELARFVALNRFGARSIDFADPAAVLTLNRALLKDLYGVSEWGVPEGYLCPPIPGRSDYLHYMADLLASSNGGEIPRGAAVRCLDIGVGANCVYPIIGRGEYGWSFVGTDIDPAALAWAKRLVEANEGLAGGVELRRQASPRAVLEGIVRAGEVFDLSMCNPPFYASEAEVQEASRRKWKNLGHGATIKKNFGGTGVELWCPGGEAAFVRRLIDESARVPSKVLWFSSLVSRASEVPGLYEALEKAGADDARTIEMEQGQKKSRIVAWTFLDEGRRREWAARFKPGALRSR